MTELQTAAVQIQKAKKPEDVFGPLTGSPAEQEEQAHRIYKRLARVCHSDLYTGHPETIRVMAGAAFTLLNQWWEQAQLRIEKGVYGKPQLGTIATKTATYELDAIAYRTDLAIIYSSVYNGSPVWVKVAVSPGVNDLLEREVKVLQQLAKTPAIARYLPALRESFIVKTDAGAPRRVTVFDAPAGYIPMTGVMAEFPQGVDPRHCIWMWKRLLHVLDFAHHHSIIHGAVLPDHVYVHPTTHGCMLWEWGFAVSPGQKAIGICTGRKTWYPPEVEAKQPLRPATDLYMSAECIAYVLGRDPGLSLPGAPTRLTRLIQACLIASPNGRTQSGRDLYDDVTAAASALYGPPQYVPLEMGT